MHNAKRLLDFPSLLNARDLGGYPTSDGAETRWRDHPFWRERLKAAPESAGATQAFHF